MVSQNNNFIFIFYSGRVICITSARDNDSIKNLKDIAHNTIVQINKKASMAPPPTTSDSSSTTPPQYVNIHTLP